VVLRRRKTECRNGVNLVFMAGSNREKSARVFFAIWPCQAERAALSAWRPLLHEACGGRMMRPDTLHATLAFLGNVATHRLQALQLAAREVSGAPFLLSFDVARYWAHNRIVYAAPGSEPELLLQLVSELERSLRRHRFRFDQRSYKPHVTLLRHAQWDGGPLPEVAPVAWQVREFALVQSLSDDRGARYQVLARFPLA
jgi:RNA 2',3'-cyclic 3'-phosphodiesterase